MTDQPTTADLLFPLLVEASNEADLDINDQDIRDGHHRIEPFVSLARKAFELGAKLAAEELGAYPLRYVRLVSDELDRLKAEVEQLKAERAHAAALRDWLAAEADDDLRARYFRLITQEKANGAPYVRPNFADLPPFDSTEVREHPGTGQPMTAVPHPADGTQAEPSSEPEVRHALTSHGHPCCGKAPSEPPNAIARCGGVHMCKTCAANRDAIHGNSSEQDGAAA